MLRCYAGVSSVLGQGSNEAWCGAGTGDSFDDQPYFAMGGYPTRIGVWSSSNIDGYGKIPPYIQSILLFL